MHSITNHIYYTGVQNPNMRIFDVIMCTDYGTSYNSYIVKGSKKTAVIEAAHKSFLENFEENVVDVLGKAPIDYLVLNHTEPDHTGCIADFLKLYPDVTVVCSQAAAIYIKEITNRPDLKIQIVKDSESISLGDKTLQFISAPFLHWPDSMFTYVPEDKVLFTCDFLGSHYCEPQIYDTRIVYPEAYQGALEYYYACIFGPFPAYVRAGLAKIKDLEIDFACTSHGPVLTKKGLLDEVVAKYAQWSKEPEKRDHKLIPIFYCSAYRNTEQLAFKVREGILNILPNAEVPTCNIIEHDMAELHGMLNGSDAFLLGTMTLNRDAVPPIWGLLAGADAINIAKRPAALFGSFGWSGEAFANVTARLEGLKVNIVEEPYKVKFVPSEEQLQGAVVFGETFAKSLK